MIMFDFVRMFNPDMENLMQTDQLLTSVVILSLFGLAGRPVSRLETRLCTGGGFERIRAGLLRLRR